MDQPGNHPAESRLAAAPEVLSAVIPEMTSHSSSALRRLIGVVLFGPAGLLLASVSAAEPETTASPAPSALVDKMREDVLRMSEFFDTTLPGTLSQYRVVMDFTPKFSDFRDNEYVRYPIELRYGLRPKWELIGGVTPFSPNPFNSGRDHRWGPGEVQFGVRHDAGRIPWLYDAVTIGLQARAPLGQPPVELNDHYIHLLPSISASRQLPWPHTTFLTEFSYDRQLGAQLTNPPPGVLHRNVIQVEPGVLYKPGEFGGFFDYSFRHFSEDTGSHLGHEFKIGPIWDVPLARSAKWGLPGKWQVELAYRYSTEEGVGSSQGITARVHWRTTLREMLKQSAN